MSRIPIRNTTPIFQIAIHVALRALAYAGLAGIGFGIVGGLTGALSAVVVIMGLRGPVQALTGNANHLDNLCALAALMGGSIAAMTGAVGGALAFLIVGLQPFAPTRNLIVFRRLGGLQRRAAYRRTRGPY